MRAYPTKLISIAGYSYTGSTFLCGLLTQVERVLAIGELHYYRALDYPCSRCGEPCPVLQQVERRSIDPTDLYLQASNAAASFGYDTLVISDKNLPILKLYLQPKESDAILMFKSPEAFVASYVRHRYTSDGGFDVAGRLVHWYSELLQEAESLFGKVFYLQYEDLARDHDRLVRAICEYFDLGTPPQEYKYPPDDWHNVAGNTEAYFGKRIYFDDRWKTELSPELLRFIANHEIQDLYKVLQGRRSY